MRSISERRSAFESLRPQQGFVAVGLDTFGSPDEQEPYVVGAFMTADEARSAAEAEKSQGADKAFVLGSDGTHTEV